jgi:hypothetical protein
MPGDLCAALAILKSLFGSISRPRLRVFLKPVIQTQSVTQSATQSIAAVYMML